MFRLIITVFLAVTLASVGSCRCANNGDDQDGGASLPSKRGSAAHIGVTKAGEKVVRGGRESVSTPPPQIPGEPRRMRGRATHPEPTEPDPIEGPFTLEQATEGLEGSGRLVAVINANLGRIRCTLDATKAPRTVANFVGLVRGTRPWWNPYGGAWVEQGFYSGLNFFRVIPGTKIEGGCPLSLGTGGPGYTFEPEIVEGFGHDVAGVLSMVVDDEGGAGSQFFITDGAAPHFNGRHAPFGRCTPTDAIFRMARVPQSGENRPLTDVMIQSISIERED